MLFVRGRTLNKGMRKKGVSPLIAAVILIGMTVTVSILIGGWAQQMVRARSDELKNQTETQLGCSYANLYIENAVYDCSANNLSITVRNVGQVALTVSKIFVRNGTGVNKTTLEYDIFGGTQTFSVGDRKTINTSTAASGLNNTIEKIYVSSTNCPRARDTYTFESSDYSNC